MELVTDKALIDRYERVVIGAFREGSKRLIRDVSGSRFTERGCTIYWDRSTGIWAHFRKRPNKYWCPFGIDDPTNRKNIANTVQINPSRVGHKGTGGAFIRDVQSGAVYLAHSGRIGGESVGKTDVFLKYFDTENIRVGRSIKRYILISQINDPNLRGRIADFVRAAATFKRRGKIVPHGEARTPQELTGDEYAGEIMYARKGYVSTVRRHGRVFKHLKRELAKRGVTKLKRDTNRDLYLDGNGRNVLFEIKTDSTYGLYTAVGQLMLLGRAVTHSAKCFLVAPPISDENRRRLQSLRIGFIEYEERGEAIRFTGLEQACRACGV
jgi:hypothetical protein